MKILDSRSEQVYEDVVLLASQICNTPISLVSLVEEDRQWFKAKIGLDISQTSKEVSFCAHAIQQSATLVVTDAQRDPRFTNNELVTGDFHLRFYAGAPVYANDEPVGTVCVIAKEPRDFSRQQIEALEALARQVSAHLQLRLQNEMLTEREDQLFQAMRRAEELSAQFASEERFVRAISDAAPGLVSYLDADLNYRFANKAYLDWFGRTPEQLYGSNLRDLLGEALFSANEPYVRKALAGEPQLFERSHPLVGGQTRHMLANYIPDVGQNGSVKGIFVTVTDISRQKETELELRQAANVLETISEGVVVTDQHGTVLSVNPAFCSITGFDEDEAIGRSIQELSQDMDELHSFDQISDQLHETGHWEGDVWTHRKDGESYLQHRTLSFVRDGFGEPNRYVAVIRDVTARWKKDEEVRRQAMHDELTGLANRHLLTLRLSQLMAQSSREGRFIVLMFCDLDGFKAINDRLGHGAGDTVLKTVATRLQAQVRQTDTVARLGGDEFVVLLDNPTNTTEVERVAKRIVKSIGKAIVIDGNPVNVGISIGITTSGVATESADQLLERADLAMYAAKSAGKNGYHFL